MASFTKFIDMYKEGKVSAGTMAKAAAFREELEKIAAGPSGDTSTFLRYLATGLAVSAGLGVASAGASMAGKAYDEYSLNAKKEDLFKEMLRLHPDLSQSKERAKLYFEALLHFSPVVAQNPLTAGAYVKQALQYDHVAGGPLPASVNELSQIQKQTAEARRNAPMSPVGHVLQGITGAPEKVTPSMWSFKDYAGQ